MTAIDQLLARALLRNSPRVPTDTVPYEDCVYPVLTPDGTALVDDDPADTAAAARLQILCEAVVAASTPDTLEFVTEQLPEPRSAWVLGCALQLADTDEGARFWWQYAAGAGDVAASYCLYLHHLSRGEEHAAAFWHNQAGFDTPTDSEPLSLTGGCPTTHQIRFDATLATVLRVLSHLHTPGTRTRTHRADAVANYVARAVTNGYARHPGVEIPVPEPRFADRIAFILSHTPPWNIRRPRPRPAPTLPTRAAHSRTGITRHLHEAARGAHC
ncbi:hypothetical protein ACH40E_20755 [Streptomyces acidicola]|uniref:hypothetical protein n=1 Tax=Streptomyces acidicola TaxID=2596892 RepID=UPI003795D3D7